MIVDLIIPFGDALLSRSPPDGPILQQEKSQIAATLFLKHALIGVLSFISWNYSRTHISEANKCKTLSELDILGMKID
jgi:hypothetical protein